jgi:dTDP-4-dehydrorhamnose reductase
MRRPVKNKDKILVFGRGQMAGFIPDYFPGVVISAADVTKPEEIEKDIKEYKPDVVINTAAKTSIDWCELNKTEAFNVNTLGAYNVWEICKKYGVFLCYFSSGCIFSSRTYDEVYREEDTPNPQCYYSWTKVWAENILGKDENLLVLRPRVVISTKVDNRNTISKWLTYTHFISDLNTVSVIEDMFPVVADMVARRISGTFHIANQGTISPLEVATILRSEVNPELSITETSLEEVNSNLVAKRVTTVLSCDRLRAVGYSLPPVKESVAGTISKFKENLKKAGGLKALERVRQETKAKYSLKKKEASTFSAAK